MDAVDNSMRVQLGITCLYLRILISRVFSLIIIYYGRCFYILSTNNDRGYISSTTVKEYKSDAVDISLIIFVEMV